jgi:myo-inositol-1(or 4)-monophosphatase
VAGTKKIGNSLAATGFPYDVFERAGEIVRPLERVLSRARALRRDGAASLDLSFVAAGRADAFFESGLKPWDVAGGILLVEVAGGKVSDYRGQGYVLGQSQDILATNFCLHEDYLGLLT